MRYEAAIASQHLTPNQSASRLILRKSRDENFRLFYRTQNTLRIIVFINFSTLLSIFLLPEIIARVHYVSFLVAA